MSRRIEKLTRTIRDIVSDTIQNHLSDPRVLTLTSVTRVELLPDMSLARVYLSMFEPNIKRQELCLQAISNASGFIRTRLAGFLKTRTCPALDFQMDYTLLKHIEFNELLDQVARDRQPEPSEPSAEETHEE